MKLLLRFSATVLLFTVAVCAVATVAHRADKESKLILQCREQLANQGLQHVNVMCRGSQAFLAGEVACLSEKNAATDLIGAMDGIQQVSSMSLIVGNPGKPVE